MKERERKRERERERERERGEIERGRETLAMSVYVCERVDVRFIKGVEMES